MATDIRATTEDPQHTAFRVLSTAWTQERATCVRLRARLWLYAALAFVAGAAAGLSW